MLLLCSCIRQNTPSAEGYEGWSRNRKAIRENAALARYYTFQNIGERKRRVDNHSGWAGDLEFAGKPPEELQVVNGRWPWKKAARLDRKPLAVAAIDIENKSFSVEMWYRPHGPGSISGPSPRRTGTLLAVNNGYYAGWRLTMEYPDRILKFEMARPKPDGAISIQTIEPVENGVWHHVAVSWDGEQMRLYVDGLLAASGNYSGNYHPGESFNSMFKFF